jgi:hypothetical protein
MGTCQVSIGYHMIFIKKWNKNHKFIHHEMRLAMGITRIECALLPPCAALILITHVALNVTIIHKRVNLVVMALHP